MGREKAMTNKESRKEELRIMSLPKMQEKIKEAMGEEDGFDSVMCGKFNRAVSYDRCSRCENRHCDGYSYRLPLAIDRDNPERGLEGMLHGSLIMRRSFGNREWYLTITTEQDVNTLSGGTPALALLRALASQWGIEI
jgi:hypothetical protein